MDRGARQVRTNARIYIMQAEDGTIKLGHSNNPERRAKQIGRPVAIVHTTDVLEHVERIERLAHRVLALHGRHIRGEWFDATIESALTAIEIAVRQAEAHELPLGGVVYTNGSTETRAPRDVVRPKWKYLTMSLGADTIAIIDALRQAERPQLSRTAMVKRLVFDAARKSPRARERQKERA
jgi:hypothetical protein